MDRLLEQATPQYEFPTALLEVVGKALYGWGDDEPNEATGYTAVYESVKVAAAVHAAGYRLNAYEPLVKALRDITKTVYSDDAPLDSPSYSALHLECIRIARAALATVESSPEREGGEHRPAIGLSSAGAHKLCMKCGEPWPCRSVVSR